MIIAGEIHTSNDISFANTQATSTITTVTLCVWLKNPVYIVSVDFTWDYCSIIVSKLGKKKFLEYSGNYKVHIMRSEPLLDLDQFTEDLLLLAKANSDKCEL